MSISQVSENINRRRNKGGVCVWLFGISAILNIFGFLGLGILFERINEPSEIKILCSEEVMKGLQATSSAQIPKVKAKVKKP